MLTNHTAYKIVKVTDYSKKILYLVHQFHNHQLKNVIEFTDMINTPSKIFQGTILRVKESKTKAYSCTYCRKNKLQYM